MAVKIVAVNLLPVTAGIFLSKQNTEIVSDNGTIKVTLDNHCSLLKYLNIGGEVGGVFMEPHYPERQVWIDCPLAPYIYTYK